MKHLFILIVITALTASCSNNSANNSTETSKNEPTGIELKEELPPLKTSQSNMGKLKMHQDGYSIGKKTELTELRKQLKNKDCDIIEIIWIWDSSPKYDDMPMMIVYNKIDGSLKEIYTSTNVIEDYKNINPQCLEQFLINGETSFYSLEAYCKDAKYDFNNREMNQTAVGDKPDQSELDGSVNIVKDYIKEKAQDESSIEFLEWSKVSALGKDWIVRCKYKGTNSLGAFVTTNSWFYIQGGKVVDIKQIE